MAVLSTRTQAASLVGGRLAASPRRVVLAPARHSGSHGRAEALISRAGDNGRGDSNFMAGFLAGGVLFGALGFVFAPQISKALLGDDQRLKLPRFMEEEQPKDPEQTKQDLIEKIAQLNASIDEVAAQLKVKEEPVKVESSA